MTRRSFNKILIVILVIVWSFAGYKLVIYLTIKKQIDATNQVEINPIPNILVKRNEFKLIEIDRDPFLNAFSKKNIKQTPIHRKQSNSVILTNLKSWPKIEYFGYVQNESNKNPLVLLKINNKINRARLGEVFEDLIVKEVYSDSIVVFKGKEKRIIKKNI